VEGTEWAAGSKGCEGSDMVEGVGANKK